MATYKAEFLSHYYEHRLRPRHAYAMGLVYWWARAASYAPEAVNFLVQLPILGRAAKWIGGIAPQRSIPRFAPVPFTTWLRRRAPVNAGAPDVLLWPDTFNNYFHPDVAKAAVEVLEYAGFHVTIPQRSLCCGRPLYDFGMLDTAKGMLRQILSELSPQIQQGMPLIGLEPSCLAVFRDEMCNLLPDDWNARRLRDQCFTLSEFLQKHGGGWKAPKLTRKAIVHGHCHQKALMGMAAEEQQFRNLGLDYQMLDSGCCGMAGSFGFEKDHYDVSIACGERVLLPKVREASGETLIIADGFSCREQITQTTGRTPLHTAEVLQLEIHGGRPIRKQESPQSLVKWAIAGLAITAVVIGLRWWRAR
jgi:Fe-S oxidoreductase